MDFLLKYMDNSIVKSYILNILLVRDGARKICIVDTACLIGCTSGIGSVMRDIRQLLITHSLVYDIQENGEYHRWIISRSNEKLSDFSYLSVGKALDMFIIENDRWYSSDVIRITGVIKISDDTPLYIEVHEESMIARDIFLLSLIEKTEQWNIILRKYGHVCSYEISTESSTLPQRVLAVQNGDYNFIITHLNEYKSDLLHMTIQEEKASTLWSVFSNLSPYTWTTDMILLKNLYIQS